MQLDSDLIHTTQEECKVSQDDIVRRAEDDQVCVGHRHRGKYAGLWNIDMLEILEALEVLPTCSTWSSESRG